MSSPQNMTSNHSNNLHLTPAMKTEQDNAVDSFLDTVTGENSNQFSDQTDKSDFERNDQSGMEAAEETGCEGEGLRPEELDEEGRAAGDSSQSSAEWGNTKTVVKEESGSHMRHLCPIAKCIDRRFGIYLINQIMFEITALTERLGRFIKLKS